MQENDNLICKSPGVYFHPYIEQRPTQYGTGVFAKHHIPADTIIIRERAVSLLKETLGTDVHKYTCLSIQQLLTHNKEYFLSLVPFDLDEYAIEELKDPGIEYWHKELLPELTTEEMRLYYMKFSRNVFLLDKEKEAQRLAILFLGTRLNHSCEPSVIYKQNGEEMIFLTTKSIEPDTEMFDTYLTHQMLKSKAERQEYLLTNYGFLCRCAKCENDL
jgi:hypothetical protein